MARGGLDYEGIAAVYATFQADGSVSSVMLASGVAAVEGKAVTIVGNKIAGYGSAGDTLLGRIDTYENDHYMTVQTGGFSTMPGVSGSLPTAGDFLVVDGSGAVQASTGAVGPARAISVDNTANVNNVMVLIC
jgi:hypothetical protein